MVDKNPGLNQQGVSHAGVQGAIMPSGMVKQAAKHEALSASTGSFGYEPHESSPRGKAKNWQGYTCPNCQGSMRTRSTGRANSGKYVVRTKHCEDCGLKGVTGEFWIPDLEGVTNIESFDEEQLFAKRMRRRASQFFGIKSGHTKTPRNLNFKGAAVHGGKWNCHPECMEKNHVG